MSAKKKELTISALKKQLEGLERKELERLLCELYKFNEAAEQMINLRLLDEAYAQKLLEQYEERLYNIFFQDNLMRAGFSLRMAKSVVSDFKKICRNDELVLELKLYFAECGTEFTNMFGDIDEAFYNAVCSAFHDVAAAAAEDERLFLKWGDRLKNIIGDMGGIGWGVYDYMEEEYMIIPWVKNKKQ